MSELRLYFPVQITELNQSARKDHKCPEWRNIAKNFKFSAIAEKKKLNQLQFYGHCVYTRTVHRIKSDIVDICEVDWLSNKSYYWRAHKHPNKASLKLYRCKLEIMYFWLSVPGP